MRSTTLRFPRFTSGTSRRKRQVMSNMLVELAYVGSHGFNLAFPTDLNQVPVNLLSSSDSGDRPYPELSGYWWQHHNGISN